MNESEEGNPYLARLKQMKDSMKSSLTKKENDELDRFVQKLKDDREEYIANGHDTRELQDASQAMEDKIIGESAEQEIDVCAQLCKYVFFFFRPVF